MKSYLVGGAVRDELLGQPMTERDWVVVGATPQALLDAGYRRVGKDFPVFLHPETSEEYALARTERKTGRGYHGFEMPFSPRTSRSRKTCAARPHDQCHRARGRRKPHRSLRGPTRPRGPHAAPRIGGLQRGPGAHPAGRAIPRALQPLGFRVAAETIARMRMMVASGEVDELVAERVWQETEKALGEPAPRSTSRCCTIAARWHMFPEIDALYGVPQPEKWHPKSTLACTRNSCSRWRPT